MAPEWDIGEHDVAAVERLAEGICRLPTLSSPVDLPMEASVIEGGSFSARVYALPDRAAGCQLRIYFSGDAGVRSDWSAWVRRDGPDRRDRTPPGLARRFRKAFKPVNIATWKGAEGRGAPKWVRTAHWWVGRDYQHLREDVTAQIWLFLLQAGIVGDEARGYAYPWFWSYLERRFELTVDESMKVFNTLLKQFWRAPNARAWPAYVGQYKYFSPIRVERRRSHAASRSSAKPSSDDFTVVEVIRATEIPQSTLYDMIRQGEVALTISSPALNNRKPAMLIPAEEVQRLKSQRRHKPKALIELRQRVTGSTYHAARKWVWRQQQLRRTAAEIRARLANIRM
jgi:hypothetical protein